MLLPPRGPGRSACTDPLGDLGDELALDAAHHLGAGFLLGEGGDALQLGGDQRAFVLDRLAQRLELSFAPGQSLFVGVELAKTALETLLALIGALLELCDLGAAFANLSLGFIATAGRFLFRGQQHGLGFLLDRAHLIEAAFGVRVVRDLHLRDASARVDQCSSRKCGCNNHQPDKGDDLDADGIGTSEVGRGAPCWECPVWGKGPGRNPQRLVAPVGAGPRLAGRSPQKTVHIVRARAMPGMFR